MRVALFITCFNDLLFPEVGQAVVRLLTRLGCDVEFPEAQTCCGQMHFNTGYRDECVPLARNFAAAFKGYDAVVTPSPSCASMVRHSYPTVAEHGREHGAEPGLPAALDGGVAGTSTSCRSSSWTCSRWRTSARGSRIQRGVPPDLPRRCASWASAIGRSGCSTTWRA